VPVVDLRRYAFTLRFAGTRTYWDSNVPEAHIPGESQLMTGVQLTDAGRKLARKMIRAEKQREKAETVVMVAQAKQTQKEWLQERGAWPPGCHPPHYVGEGWDEPSPP
jgi:hypothetical protein